MCLALGARNFDGEEFHLRSTTIWTNQNAATPRRNLIIKQTNFLLVACIRTVTYEVEYVHLILVHNLYLRLSIKHKFKLNKK